MNDKANATAPCDCDPDLPSQLCVRYCAGECDGFDETPPNRTPSELESEFRDGVPSIVGPIPEIVSDYFKRVYPEYYVQIITNINRERGPEPTAHLLSSKAMPNELMCAFWWARSPEGDAFWRVVAQREQSQ